jgi:lipopolysaccharide/colanic/teichoic acid biosynthesis glycosyltransferase
MYRHFLKRVIGFFGALVAIILLSPVFVFVIIWLQFANKGAGAFFFQERIGRNDKPFKIIKFKTMTDERGADGKLLPDAQRLTKVGRFVRATSIDELPQLINILVGDMAFIGPRALPTTYQFFFTEEEQHRHDVRPGMTGWAQINGLRGDTPIDRRIQYDLWYIENWTLGLDIKILLLTLVKGFVDKNAY